MVSLPRDEAATRVNRLQQMLQQKGWDGVLLVQNIDLYYFTGTAQQGVGFIPAAGEPSLFIKKDWRRAQSESPWRRVEGIKSIKELPQRWREAGCSCSGQLGVEMDVLPVRDFHGYVNLFPQVKWEDASPLIASVRAVKSPLELDALRASARLHGEMFRQVPHWLQEGMRDVELAARLEAFARSRGHLGLIRFRGLNQELFFGLILFGPAGALASGYDSPLGGKGLSPTFPLGSSGVKAERNQPLLVDYGGNYTGYVIDQTRLYVLGRLSGKLERGFQVALEIQAELVELGRPGVAAGELFQVARRRAIREGYGDYFMGYSSPTRFVGHGLGLELNEWPVLAENNSLPLSEGMTLALEPKFVFPGEGAVGIENTFVVTAAGLEKISREPADDLVSLT